MVLPPSRWNTVSTRFTHTFSDKLATKVSLYNTKNAFFLSRGRLKIVHGNNVFPVTLLTQHLPVSYWVVLLISQLPPHLHEQ
jgi:hypothetical protein